MGNEDDRVHVRTPQQQAAMQHPTRHRITLALGEPMTVSDLARELGVNKGNIAHHIAVLERAGLVFRVGTRTGRGGTGVLYRSSPLRLDGREATHALVQTVEEGLAIDPDAFAFLRTVRLSPQQARHLAEHLEKLVSEIEPQSSSPRHGVFVSAFRA